MFSAGESGLGEHAHHVDGILVEEEPRVRELDHAPRARARPDEDQPASARLGALFRLDEGVKSRRVQERQIAKIEHGRRDVILFRPRQMLLQDLGALDVELAAQHDPRDTVDRFDTDRQLFGWPHRGSHPRIDARAGGIRQTVGRDRDRANHALGFGHLRLLLPTPVTRGCVAEKRYDGARDGVSKHPAPRVLVADGPGVRLDEVTRTVVRLGHDVIARESSLPDVARITAVERPDVALVIVHEASAKALQLIDRIVHEAACPVIAVLDVQDRGFVSEAAKRGIFAYISGGHDEQEMQSSIEIVLRRFAEYHELEGAFTRRAITERAKGTLMERHGIGEHAAFEMLRDESRRTHRKLVDLADAVVAGHPLLLDRSTGAREQET
jgi:AmiR/NasT family two-component response regulator